MGVNGLELILYRGSDFEQLSNARKAVFFSSSESFASSYGTVRKYSVNIDTPFDTSSKEDIMKLLSVVGSVTDSYDDMEYESYEELEMSGLLYADTWEIFEPHMNKIESMGYDGMIIYEGGIQNYVTFKSNSFNLVSK